MIGTFETRVDRLSPVSAEARRRYLDLPLTRTAHTEAHASVAAFRQIELGGHEAAPVPERRLRVAAWNLQRCLYPKAAAQLLQQHGVGLALLTEMDDGMLRTGQAHTTARMAELLRCRYAYGLEFLELLATPPPAGFPRVDDDNRAGFHGNGLLTALPIERLALIRLDEVADWYIAPKGGERRVGNRMAVAASVNWGGRRFVACSVHLESATDGEGRVTQMRTLLDAIEQMAEGLPVLIGGDLNTHVQPGRHDDPAEPLFSAAKQRGYDFAAANLARPTTRDSVWTESEGTRQLDWFCTRGLAVSDPEVVASLDPDGHPLTDHELILLSIGAS